MHLANITEMLLLMLTIHFAMFLYISRDQGLIEPVHGAVGENSCDIGTLQTAVSHE